MVATFKDLGYKKIFVSLDGSEQQYKVLDRAITVADNNGAELIIGHVIDTSAMEVGGNKVPEGTVDNLKAAFLESIAEPLAEAKSLATIPQVTVIQEEGRVRETLEDKMLDVIKPDLVLCGARGLSKVKYALLGSISSFLLRSCECDILVVK